MAICDRTSSSGTYSATVPVGSYSVTAKGFGYQSQTMNGVQVTDGQATTENFALQVAPSGTLTGTVTDGSGQGWPLYAKVSVPGTSASTYTNPSTGQYTLTLPENGSYKVTATLTGQPGGATRSTMFKTSGTGAQQRVEVQFPKLAANQ